MDNTLPSFLHRTPEQIRDENARQQILRDAALKGAKQTPAEIKIGYAMMAEEAIRGNLELIDAKAQPEVYYETRMQLAEALAEQGKFADAAKIDPQYQAFADAVTRDDDEVCDCVPDTTELQGQNARGENVSQLIEIPNQFIAAEVYSEKHGKIVPLVKCAICGDINIKADHDSSHNLVEVEKHYA